jgi:hypothetical protein
LHLSHPHHFIAEMTAQVLFRAEVNLLPQHGGKVLLRHDHLEEADRNARFELYQQVNVACWTRGLLQRRAEQRQAPDVMASTQFVQGLMVMENLPQFVDACRNPGSGRAAYDRRGSRGANL